MRIKIILGVVVAAGAAPGRAAPLSAGMQVALVEECLSPATRQITPLLVAALAARGIKVAPNAPLKIRIDAQPCDEFAFASAGPRDLDDAPRGPMGAPIAAPISGREKYVTQASLRLTLMETSAAAAPRAVATAVRKTPVPVGRAGWTKVPELVRPTLDALLAAPGNVTDPGPRTASEK